MTKREWVAAGVVFAALTATTAARAQTPCPSQARVDVLERQGVAERTARRDGAALALFQQAYELCHGARALARIGLAEKALGRWRAAEEHLAAALEFRRDRWIVQNRAALTGELERVRDHLGEIVLLGTGPTAEVWIGDERVGTWPTETPVRVAAGTVTVSVRATGYVTVTRTVQVVAREVARESITLAREEPPPEVRPAAVVAPPAPVECPRVTVVERPSPRVEPVVVREARGGVLPVLGGVTAGVAVTALVATVIVHANRERTITDTNTAYEADMDCSPWEKDRAYCERLHNPAVAADQGLTPWVVAGYATAGVFAITSAVLFGIAPSRGRETRASGWRCGAGPGVVGLACGASF